MFTTKNILILVGRNALVSLIVVGLSLGAIFFISNKIVHLSDSVALNRNLETRLSKRTELFEILKHDAQIVGTSDVQIDNAFVSSDNILEFVNALDNLAQSRSIVQTYRFETPALSTISAPFPISTILYTNNLEATTIAGFSDYLKAFDRLPYLTKIEGFNIASQDPLGWQGVSTASFKATLYTKAVQ